MSDVNEKIKKTIEENKVVLYMKGNKSMPQCGFSSKVAGVLNYIGVEYEDINVLADEVVRQ
jgi:monothiol glutaredoxin